MVTKKKEKMPEEKFSRTTCAGCDAEFKPGAYGGFESTEIYLGPHRAWVCSGRGWYRGAKKSCYIAAVTKAELCPGCGAEGTSPGQICEKCQELLALARGNPDVRERTLFSFNTNGFFGRFAQNYNEAPADVRPLAKALAEEAKTLMRHLAEGCTVGEFYEKEHRRDLTVPLRSADDRRLSKGGADYDDPSAELLPRQAEALDRFARGLKPYFDHVYELGKSMGHSFLVRLATGDMTREQFEELDEKVEKEKRGESEEDES